MKIIELEETLQTNERSTKKITHTHLYIKSTRVETSSSSSSTKKGNVNGNIFGAENKKKRRLAQIFMSGHMAKSESFHFIHTKDLLIFSALLNMCIVKQNQPHKSQATRYSVQT